MYTRTRTHAQVYDSTSSENRHWGCITAMQPGQGLTSKAVLHEEMNVWKVSIPCKSPLHKFPYFSFFRRPQG